MVFTVAIVGRPNVGKSTLFNRLVGRRAAIVDPTPGVTRDRREGAARIADLAFRAIDTAGLEDATGDTLEAAMRAQTERALAEADVALFLVDARAGLTPLDRHFATWLRRQHAKVILLANKAEGKAGTAGALDAFALGLGEPIEISAEHGDGMGELYDALKPFAPKPDEADAATETDGAPRPLHLAILGRPNVGKSTLVNRLVGEERMLTGPEPGVTRDAIAIDWRWHGRPVRLVDTAGLRRRARVTAALEKASVADALRAVRFADLVVLVLDATAPLERQDLAIARQALEEGRALVVAANKWDLVADVQATRRAIAERLEESLAQARGVPVVALSALAGEGIGRLMRAVLAADRAWNCRLATGPLNRWLDEMITRHAAPTAAGRPVRPRYITQVKARPPTFALFVNRPEDVEESYLRYLTNGLRETFDLAGVPIRILPRRGKNPYVDKAG
jgi:GTPase